MENVVHPFLCYLACVCVHVFWSYRCITYPLLLYIYSVCTIIFVSAQGGLRPCLHTIEGLDWAPDSDLIMCAMYKRSFVEVQYVRVQ